jgi:hypothetical protein
LSGRVKAIEIDRGSGGRIGVENQPSGRYIVKPVTRSQNGV